MHVDHGGGRVTLRGLQHKRALYRAGELHSRFSAWMLQVTPMR